MKDKRVLVLQEELVNLPMPFQDREMIANSAMFMFLWRIQQVKV